MTSKPNSRRLKLHNTNPNKIKMGYHLNFRLGLNNIYIIYCWHAYFHNLFLKGTMIWKWEFTSNKSVESSQKATQIYKIDYFTMQD
jgi:hypothetical protein